MKDDFYVGYRPDAPEGLASFTKRVVLGVAGLVLCVAALLAFSQKPFDPGFFEYGAVSEHVGTIWVGSAPLLAVEQSGEELPRLVPLVLPGKHGAAGAVARLDGRRVRLEGTRISRGDWLMVEVVPGSVEDLGPGAAQPEGAAVGRLLARGEVVDAKCFLGVMKPGRGKPHRACAARCLAGGVPAMFWVPSERGEWTFLLESASGDAWGAEAVRWTGRPVTLEGEVWRVGEGWVLRALPPERGG